MPYLPYEEPGLKVILSLASFLLLLNTVRYVLDRLLYCGIIGEILIGIIWGLPVGGTAWLTQGTQEAVQSFGYLGLIGLVFEGGLCTDLAMLRKSVYMSVSLATVGLLMPIAFSFLLRAFPFSSGSERLYTTPLAAFSAGASLCSTSLGTTFMILSAAGLQKTRIGVILVGAALMDDVVGLVMVNIVVSLGEGRLGGWPIARPIVASFGLLLTTLFICHYIIRPVCQKFSAFCLQERESSPASSCSVGNTISRLARSIPHLNFILSTTILAAYLTIASYIDASVLFAAFIAGGLVNYATTTIQQSAATVGNNLSMYEVYYKPSMDHILVPFFFASIGFSIPITKMFDAPILWKGIVYALLMAFAKGLVSLVIYSEYLLCRMRNTKQQHPERRMPTQTPPHGTALLAGLAMMARGEIGFLIASLSQSSNVLILKSRRASIPDVFDDQLFLVITWAVVLCTIVGPLGVGMVVRRWRKDVLGNSLLREAT